MKLALVLSILFVLFSSSALGFGFDVTLEPIRDQITRGESADFTVTFVNKLPKTNVLRLASEDFTRWTLQTDPQSARLSGVMIPSGGTASAVLQLFPSKQITPGRYTIQVEFRSETNGDVLRKGLDVNYVSLESILRKYVPELQVSINLPHEGMLDPRGDRNGVTSIDVGVKNKNPLYLENVIVRLKSQLFDMETSIGDLQPLERKFATFDVKLDPHETPKTDTLLAAAVIGNITFVDIETFEIAGYELPFVESSSSQEAFMKTATSVEVSNPSNVAKEQDVLLETRFLQSLFTSTSPHATITTQDGKRLLTWHVTLPASGSIILRATTNYRPFFYILIIALAALGIYLRLRSPLVIFKSVREVAKHEGGISMFKVILHIKNRSKHSLHGIEVTDSVPSIADIRPGEMSGTLPPTKILTNTRKGSIAKWELHALEGHEERVLSYLVKSKLSILGTLEIPLAKARFVTKKGRHIISRSNVVKLNA